MVRTTKALLQEQGYPGTGLNEIIRRSGAPKGSMYHYFPGGKEALGAAALELAGEEIRAQLVALGDLPPAEAIVRSAEILGRELAASGFGAGSPVATVALEMSSASDVLREACAKVYDVWHQLLQENLMRAGVPETTARAAAMVTLSTIEGALLLSRVQRSLEPLQRATEVLALLASQLGPHTPEPPPFDHAWLRAD